MAHSESGLRAVFVTAELAPFAKVGGLADVTASLPRALRRHGVDVSVILPLYGGQRADDGELRATGASFEVWMDGAHRRVNVLQASDGRRRLFFLENEDYFARAGIYGTSGEDFEDNAFRFALLSRGALETVRALDLKPDLFHVHDWQTALVPVYQKEVSSDRIPVVLTLHNLAYQGIFPASILSRLGLPSTLFQVDGLEFYGSLNFLKGGIQAADGLTTVSPSYAKEILSAEHGAGLEGVLRARASDLVGILNGIDPSDWHPGKDVALSVPYASNRLRGKGVNKAALQSELGLDENREAPLLAVIGRLDRQKGFDLLLEAAPELLRTGAQLVVLGSGNEQYLSAFRKLELRFPGRFSTNRGFQDSLGRRIYAGADLFLMPSRYEPCGLGQLIALRYGTLPVVRRTGGLADTIVDLDEDPANGNGFLFDAFTSDALLAACERAVTHYRDAKRWRRLVSSAMRKDFSWKASAAIYRRLYERVLGKNG